MPSPVSLSGRIVTAAVSPVRAEPQVEKKMASSYAGLTASGPASKEMVPVNVSSGARSWSNATLTPSPSIVGSAPARSPPSSSRVQPTGTKSRNSVTVQAWSLTLMADTV